MTDDKIVMCTRGQLRTERYRCAALGFLAGGVLAIFAAGLVGWQLDQWRVRNHERLLTEAQAAVETRLTTCQGIVRRLTGTPYTDVLSYAQKNDKAQGVTGVSQ